MLPGGLQIVPYYDRTDLVDSALWTVGKVLIEGILLVVVVLFIFLGDVRSSLIVVATLIITPLDRKSTRLNSSHLVISYAVFCLKKKKNKIIQIKLITMHKRERCC